MEKLSKSYIGFQEIEINDINIIKDFMDTFIDFWKEDIINFKDEVKVEDIEKICVFAYISLDEDLNYVFMFKNGTKKTYYVLENEFIAWLEKHDLVE